MKTVSRILGMLRAVYLQSYGCTAISTSMDVKL